MLSLCEFGFISVFLSVTVQQRAPGPGARGGVQLIWLRTDDQRKRYLVICPSACLRRQSAHSRTSGSKTRQSGWTGEWPNLGYLPAGWFAWFEPTLFELPCTYHAYVTRSASWSAVSCYSVNPLSIASTSTFMERCQSLPHTCFLPTRMLIA